MGSDQGDMLGLVKSRQVLDVAPVVLAGLLLDPETGEAISVFDAGDELLAESLARIRAAESELKSAKAELGAELIRRMDQDALWTRVAGSWRVETQSPMVPVSYDPDALGVVLDGLVEAGRITPAAAEAALERVVTLKPRAAGIKALAKLGSGVADLIDECRVAGEPPRRYVKVRRA